MRSLLMFTPAEAFTDETSLAVRDCLERLRRLPPEDRLNAVAAIARCWTDNVRDFRTAPTLVEE